jgi:hypothetical protein
MSVSCAIPSGYASKNDWGLIAKDLKPVCTATSEADALDQFAGFAGK